MLGLGFSFAQVAQMRHSSAPPPPPPTPFSPLDLLPMAYWNISDTASVFQDAAGTVPVSTSGDPVGLVQDLSGGGLDLTQSVTAARPTWQTGGGVWVENDLQDDDGLALATEQTVKTVVAAFQFKDGTVPTFNSGRDTFFTDAANLFGGGSVVGQSNKEFLATSASTYHASISQAAYSRTVLPLPWSLMVFKKDDDSDFPIFAFGNMSGGSPSRVWDGRFAPIALFDRVLTSGELTQLRSWAQTNLSVV